MTVANFEARHETIESLLQSLDEETQSQILLRNRQNLIGMFTSAEDIEPEIAAVRAFLDDTMDPDYRCSGDGILYQILIDALELATNFKMSIYVWEVFLERAIFEEVIDLYDPIEQASFLQAFPELFEGNDIIKGYAQKIGVLEAA